MGWADNDRHEHWYRTVKPWRHEDGRKGAVLSVWELVMYAVAVGTIVAMCVRCGPTTPPDLVTRAGVQVYLHGYYMDSRPEVFDDMDAYLEVIFPWVAFDGQPSVQDCQRRLQAGFHDAASLLASYRAEGGSEPYISGYFSETNYISHSLGDPKSGADPWATAYVHEQVHMMHWCRHMPGDATHTLYPAQWEAVAERRR